MTASNTDLHCNSDIVEYLRSDKFDVHVNMEVFVDLLRQSGSDSAHHSSNERSQV